MEEYPFISIDGIKTAEEIGRIFEKSTYKVWSKNELAIQITHMSELLKTIQEAFDITEVCSENIKVFNAKLIEFRYPPIECKIYHYIKNSMNLNDIKQFDEDKIAELFLNCYTEDYIIKLLEKWKKNSKLEERHIIFEQIVKSHLAGLYYISIPAITTQVDGILALYSEKGKTDEYLCYIAETLGDIDKSIMHDRMIPYYAFMKDVYFEHFDRRTPNSTILSRHSILHGADTKYGTKLNSIKMLTILDYLITSVMVKDLKTVVACES